MAGLTVLRNPPARQQSCKLPGEKIERLESKRVISWIEADYLKAELIKGLNIAMVEARFEDEVVLIQNIEQVLAYLRERAIRSVLITAGPIQVAGVLAAKFGFDGVYGSQYEVKDREFTGRILTHLGEDGKLNSLRAFCARYGVGLDHCVAIGDSESDIAIFKECGMSIAINYSESVKGKASEYIMTGDLADIVELLEP